MEFQSKKLGTINAGVRCKNCKTELQDGQRARQITTMRWEADPETPCSKCGSTEYESFVDLGNGNSCPSS
jgi:hypothetical protein